MRMLLSRGVLALSALRLVPHALVRAGMAARASLDADVQRWHDVLADDAGLRGLRGGAARWLWLMTFYPEFRNLFYFRAGLPGKLFRPLCPELPSLHLATGHIGPGLFIQHGFATTVTAQRIGAYCWINQQVTIGFDERGSPVLGDRVHVHAGAIVIGAVDIGDDCRIGANATVVRSLPAATTVVPARARIVRRGTQRVDEPL